MPQNEDDNDSDDSPNEREIARDAATPGGQQRRAARRAGKPASENAKIGMGFFPDGTVLPREAELAWPIVLEAAEAKGLSPYDLSIQVVQLDPPTPNGKMLAVGAPISGGAVQGTSEEPPGAALTRFVTQYYHLPRAASRNVVTYQLRFVAANRSVARADLVLPSREEILALDRADQTRRRQEGLQPPPYMPPPPQYPPSTTPITGVGAAPPQQSSNGQPSMMEMFHVFREMMQTGQQMPPQLFDLMARGFGAQQPAAPPVDKDSIVRETTAAVVQTLAQLGVIQIPPKGGAAVAQPAATAAGVAAPAVAPPKSSMERAFDRFQEIAAQQFFGGVERTFKSMMTGVGAPPPTETPVDETAPPEKPPELPWKAMAVPGATWGNGSPVHYAEDTETGGVSLQGFVLNNPVLLEKGFEKVMGLAGVVGDALKHMTTPKPQQPAQQPQMSPTAQPPQIVSEIPAAATDGTPKQSEWK